MHASLSTVIMTLITTNIFLILLTLFLRNPKWLIRVGYKMLAVFAFFAVLRFLFPVEFPFTVTKRLPGFLSWVLTACRYPLFTIGTWEVSLWTLFLIVWGIGVAVGIGRFVFDYWRISYQIVLCGKELTDKQPYKEVLEAICTERKRRNCFRVIEMPGLKAPILFGIFSPRILLPDQVQISEEDLYYILKHEIAHHFHHDMLLKVIVRLVSLVYWWDPFCILLNKQADIILEMHVDDVTAVADGVPTMEYMSCLIRMGTEALGKYAGFRNYTVGVLPRKTGALHKRTALMCGGKSGSRAVTNILVAAAALSVYIFSYAYIWEAYGTPGQGLFSETDQIDDTLFIFRAENSYFIEREDGSFDLYYNDTYHMTVDSLEYYDKAIPVYTEETYPY
ncbi:MAG: M56 family metallopeptidase [Acetatifactor sp.]|nr:M56 family metallopeptidase [Acetatifactor sp.]